MPLLQEKLPILKNQPSNLGDLVTSKTAHIRKGDRLKPELGIPSGVGYMDMGWLASLHAEEKEPIPTDPQQRWHFATLPPERPDEKACMRPAFQQAYLMVL
jgi:hypothetical protein